MRQEKEHELEQELSYFRDQFKELNQQIQLPDSLKPENLRKLIEDIEPEKHESQLIKMNFKRLAGLAACFLIVIGSIFAIRNHDIEAPTEQAPQLLAEESAQNRCNLSKVPRSVKNSVGFFGDCGQEFYEEDAVCQDSEIPETFYVKTSGEPFYADNYSELRNVVLDMNQGNNAIQFKSNSEDTIIDSENSVTDLQKRAFAASPPPESNCFLDESLQYNDGSLINKKTAKTDGKYLYYFVESNATNTMPKLYIVDSSTLQIASKLSINNNISEFYVSDDCLITVGNAKNAIPLDQLSNDIIEDAVDTQTNLPKEDQSIKVDEQIASQINIFDISNRKNPKKIKTYAQSGTYLASTLTNDTLFLVSDYKINSDLTISNTHLNSFLPATYNSISSQAQYLNTEQILINPQFNCSSYTMVSALDVKSGDISVHSVLGGSHEVYFGNDDIYLYSEDEMSSQVDEMTHIMRFSYEDYYLQFAADRTISGILNSSRFSKKDGDLRIFALSPQANGNVLYHVYAMNSNLEPIGTLDGMVMENEISSMCYINDTILLVKQGQNNELVAITTSYPDNINETCKLPLSNFKLDTLIPVSKDNLLYGLGNDVQNNTLKLCVFDVSNPKNIRVLDAYTFVNPNNESQDIYDGEVVLSNESTIGIRAYSVDKQENAKSNLCLFSFDRAKGLQLITDFEQNSEETKQGVILGNVLYTFSQDAIYSYNVQTMEQKSSILLN